VDKETAAWKGMATLTIVGALVWEGAAFLALANFVPTLISVAESGRIQKSDWKQLAFAVPVLMLIVVIGTVYLANVFDLEVQPQHPPGYTPNVIDEPTSKLDMVHVHSLLDASSAGAIALAILALLACIPALRWIWQWRSKPVMAGGLLAMLLAAFFGQFLVVASVAVLLLLLNQATLPELRERKVFIYLATLLAVSFLALLRAYLSLDWHSLVTQNGGQLRAAAVFFYQFVRFPDVIAEIVRPFAGTVPIVGVLLLLALGGTIVRLIVNPSELRNSDRVLMLLLLLLMLAVGISNPPRQETRYSYFLYPLGLLIAMTAVVHLVKLARLQDRATELVSACVVLVLFAVSEDFDARHILTIDSRETTFRVGMGIPMQAHLGEVRDDFRGVADFLKARVEPQRDIVVNAMHGVNYYYTDANYFFTEYTGSNYMMWSCRGGSVDRWTNLPLVATLDELRAKTAQARSVYFITWEFAGEQLIKSLADRHARLVYQTGSTIVIEMNGGGATTS